MGRPLGGPYDLMLAALWAVEVADVFLGTIRHYGHLWRLPMAIRSAFADLTPERLCSVHPSARPLLEAGLKLLRLTEERAPLVWLSWIGGPRGVFRCGKALDDEGTLVLQEGLGDARLPYGRDIRADTRIRALDRDLPNAGWARAGLVVAPEPPSAPAASASAPLALLPPSWGRCNVRATCLAWPVGPRDLVVPTPLGVAVGRLLLLGDPRVPLWRPFLALLGRGLPILAPLPPLTRPYGRVWGVPLGNSRPSLITGWTIWGGRRFLLPRPLWGGRRFFFPSRLWGGRRFFLSSPIWG